MQKKSTFRQRLAYVIAGQSTKEFVPALRPDGGIGFDDSSRIKNYQSKAEQLTANVGWVAAANDAISEACAAVELKLYRKKKDGDREEVKEHEILELLAEPNMVHSGEQQRQLHFSYLNFTGEAYELMMKRGRPFVPVKGQLPDSLHIIPAHQVQFKLGDTYTSSIIKYGSQEYPITTLIRDINPDPANPYMGRSRIAASAAAIDTDEQMKQWNRRFFANNARPGMVINTNGELGDKSFERLKQSLDDMHSGTDNAYKNIVIENGDAKPYSLTQSDLDFLASREFSRDELLAMFRLSPAMLGMAENVNKATADAARYQNAMVNTVPRMTQYVNLLNKILVKPYDPTLILDFENPVPEDVEAKLKAAEAGVNKWMTIDETRALYGELPLPDGLGKQLYVPKLTVTLDAVANAEEADADDAAADASGKPVKPADSAADEEPVPGSKALDGVKKKDLAAAREYRGEAKVARYRRRAERYEATLAVAVRTQFEAQRQEILTNLSAWPVSKAYNVKDAKQDKKDKLAGLIAWAAATSALSDAMYPILYQLMVETGQDAMSQVELDPTKFDPINGKVTRAARAQADKAAQSIDDETEKQLRASLGKGLDAGETTDELVARVEQVMGSALTMRTARISDSEAYRAMGSADIEAWLQSGKVTGKEWYTAKDERVCPFCNSMDGTIIAIDQPFYEEGDTVRVGDRSLNLAYEDVEAPPLHVSCRCVALDVDLA